MPKAKSRTKPKQRRYAKKRDSPAPVAEVPMHVGSTARRRTGNDLRPPTFPGECTSSNGTRYEYPIIRNPSVPGEREKMLEKREKLTLEAFRIAYENHRRKSP